MLKGNNITFSFDKHKILHGVDIEIKQGNVTALLGPNGSGKTTLLRCLTGILKPDQGAILIDGKSIDEYSNASLAKKLAYVPQFHNITFPLTLFESVLLGRREGYAWKHNPEDLDKVANILNELALTELADRPVNQLSGGEQQLGVIARALAQETPLILMDEPISNLDIRNQYEIMNRLISYSRKNEKGILIVLHDINVALTMADYLFIMKNGKLIKEGEPNSIVTNELIKSVYGVDGHIVSHNERPHLLINTSLCENK